MPPYTPLPYAVLRFSPFTAKIALIDAACCRFDGAILFRLRYDIIVFRCFDCWLSLLRRLIRASRDFVVIRELYAA